MKRSFVYLTLIGATLALAGCNSAPQVPAPEPMATVPSQKQIDWQQLEYYMFVHFGPNTFTDLQWGNGDEDPGVFNPTALDCRQWAATAKLAGMKGIIITAKHHDGFCLWPSKFSTHTVAQSSWRDGQGDVLRELSDACAAEGLKFGVYLSPWDRNHPDYGTERYNDTFVNTLGEVLSNYGDVFEQWFDGACGEGEDGKEQVYDWDLFNKTVYNKQPNAVIFSDVGPDCRWMGNERGVMGQTNWSKLTTKGFTPGKGAPSANVLNVGDKHGKRWIPAEVDVSIRPNWFYTPSDDGKTKNMIELMNIWYTSVGRNANLLLNVPPDRRGRITAEDSTALMNFKRLRDVAFAHNLAAKAKFSATNVRGESKQFAASMINDGDWNTYWAADDDVKRVDIVIDFGKPTEFNNIMVQEYIPLGQRIDGLTIATWSEQKNDWESVTYLPTVGYKWLHRFSKRTSQKILLRIENALACPTLNNVEVYNSIEW